MLRLEILKFQMELKPCPFCGCKEIELRCDTYYTGRSDIFCTNCECSTKEITVYYGDTCSNINDKLTCFPRPAAEQLKELWNNRYQEEGKKRVHE